MHVHVHARQYVNDQIAQVPVARDRFNAHDFLGDPILEGRELADDRSCRNAISMVSPWSVVSTLRMMICSFPSV